MTLTATPTDFLGVRFRSRSEAMFALHLAMQLDNVEGWWRTWSQESRVVRTGCGGFQYEPRTWVAGWTPDFLVWNVAPPGVPDFKSDADFIDAMPKVFFELIEYKPSMPSGSYIERFVSNVERWFRSERNEFRCTPNPYAFSIFYGSPYLDDRKNTCGKIVVVPSLAAENKSFVHDCKHDWTSQELLEYRFDLADGGAACSR